MPYATRTAACMLALVLAAATGAARAETSQVSASGFLVTLRKEVRATPQQVYEAIGRVDKWWNGEHTYSGDAANLSLGLAAGDCFCERWNGNSVLHAQVIYVAKGSVVRLLGGLGPLQELAVNGVLTFATATADGKTVLKVTYRVSGSPAAGLDKLAQPVEGVLDEQSTRLVKFVEGGKP